jgi:hypothetical protein
LQTATAHSLNTALNTVVQGIQHSHNSCDLPVADPIALQQQQMQVFAATSASFADSMPLTAWAPLPHLAQLTRQALKTFNN